MSKYRTKIQLLLLVISLAGIALALLSTSKYGPGVTPDSVHYFSAAKSLLSGNGYLRYNGHLFESWPPLFPTLLAVPGLFGIDPLDGARFINALAFGLIIFISGQFFLRHIKSKVLVLLGTISVLTSIPLLLVSVMAWSECLFILFLALFIFYLPEFLSRKKASSLLLLSIIAALACLQRYMGITIVVTGFISIILFCRTTPPLKRLAYATAFVLISLLPLGIWILRNYTLTLTFTGGRTPSPRTLYQNVMPALNVFTTWFASPCVTLFRRRLFTGLIMLMIPLAFFRFKKKTDIALPQVWAAGIFVAIYTLFLLAVAIITQCDPIEDRLLSPLSIFVIFLVFVGMENILHLLKRVPKSSGAGKIIIVLLYALWFFNYPFPHIHRRVSIWTRAGVWRGYNWVIWRESPLIKWLKTHPLEGKIYSNGPDTILFLNGTKTGRSPRKSEDGSQLEEDVLLESNTYLVWFNNIKRDYLCNAGELARRFKLVEIATFPDGTVYSIKKAF